MKLFRGLLAAAAIALFVYGLATSTRAHGAEGWVAPTLTQNAGPDKLWHPYLLARTPRGVALFGSPAEGHKEAPECNAELATMVGSVPPPAVVQAWCSTDTVEETIAKLDAENAKQQAAPPAAAKPKGWDI
jgi:hypothetical protein